MAGLKEAGYTRYHPDMKTKTTKQRRAATQYHYLKVDETQRSRLQSHTKRSVAGDKSEAEEAAPRKKIRAIEDGSTSETGANEDGKKKNTEEEAKKKAEEEKKKKAEEAETKRQRSGRRRSSKRNDSLAKQTRSKGAKVFWAQSRRFFVN